MSVVCLERIPTPWGQSDTVRKIAPGIIEVTTPSHGGMFLSEDRQQRIASIFPDYKTFAGGAWYEEDEDWAAVALAFPECFDDYGIRNAVYIARSAMKLRDELNKNPQFHCADHNFNPWRSVVKWLDTTTEGKAVLERSNKFLAEYANHWEYTGLSTFTENRKGWQVFFKRIGDGQRVTSHFDKYPLKPVFTANEIALLDRTPRLCPICGERITVKGETTDGRVVGTCGDAFKAEKFLIDKECE